MQSIPSIPSIPTSVSAHAVKKTVKRVQKLEQAINGLQVNSKNKKQKTTDVKAHSSNEDNKIQEFSSTTQATTSSSGTSTVNVSSQYEKVEQHQHILKRPDMYIGNVVNTKSVEPVWLMKKVEVVTASSSASTKNAEEEESKKTDTDSDNDEEEEMKDSSEEAPEETATPREVQMITKDVAVINEGLLRIFVEVLSNAIDNVWESVQAGVTPKWIKVVIDKDHCSVFNDGRNIPTISHEKYQIPIPELIFGNLMTSSNYNDEKERRTGGRNGFGVKLTNIFSKKFNIEIYNKEEKVLYKQQWTNNMYHKQPATTAHKGFPKTIEDGKNGYTKVEWYPDFQRFGCTQFSDDMIAIMHKYVYDTAMTASINKVQVSLNGEVIPVTKMSDYVGMHFTQTPKHMVSFQTADSYVVLAPAKEWTCVSFVNGIFTRDGGVHVDRWIEGIFRPVIDKISSKKIKLDLRDLKKHFFMFVFASLVNPEFESQSKHQLNAPQPTVTVPETAINKIMKWDFVEKIKEAQQLKEQLTFTKQADRKRGENKKIEGLKDANWAGKPNKQCALMVCEGLSAATYIVSGMKYGIQQFKGRDQIGLFPIKGKIMNTRNASPKALAKNKEVIGLIKALGLVYGVDYTLDENFKKLRYCKIIASTDADVDGSHITGLLYNLFHSLYPTLLERPGFFSFMRVPIVKIRAKTSGKNASSQPLNFYYYEQAKAYIENKSVPPSQVFYFKGLGTATAEDIKEDFGKRVVSLNKDAQTDVLMDNLFSSDESNYRKSWIQKYTPRTTFPTVAAGQVEQLNVSDFLNYELIEYSLSHCRRGIPSLVDGLKEANRKVLFAAIKKGLKFSGSTMKVAQFANYTAEQSAYHHGENNLCETIIKMAQRFVGSNNMPLFVNAGQMGSRSHMGKDAAAPRYIFTKLEQFTRLLFREEDDAYLTSIYEDGQEVEPTTYYPVIPYVLANGVIGSIATGYSCVIPPHDLSSIVNWIKAWLNGQSVENIPAPTPFYRGFKGAVKVENNKVVTQGIFNIDAKGRVHITEIPVGRMMTSINKYDLMLDKLETDGIIKNKDDQSTESNPSFSFSVAKEGWVPTTENLKLVDTTSYGNMVLFNHEGKLKKYGSVSEILKEFVEVRFEQYNKRKKGQLDALSHEIKMLYNKIRFVQLVLNDTIKLKDKSEEQLVEQLTSSKFDPHPTNHYDYLLNIQIRHMTSKYLKDTQVKYANIVQEHKTLEATPIKSIWEKELNELVECYQKWSAVQASGASA